jgi:lipoprotein-anchoring transpeptidase ErfK/SrfK
MNSRPVEAIASALFFRARLLFARSLLALFFVSCVSVNVHADSRYNRDAATDAYSSRTTVLRQYSLEDRIRYQLWDYTWHPDPNEPITRVRISIGQQRVYVYQGDNIAAESPVTTGKPGHLTPTGHFSVILKDIDHESNLYGLIVDKNGTVVTGDAKAGDPLPPGDVYDSADMPYYMRLTEDGVGMHGGYIPGTGPASHGCIRLPHAFAELLYSNISLGTPVDIVP